MAEPNTADKKLDGTTHAVGCWAWGPKHYECARAHIADLERDGSAARIERDEAKRLVTRLSNELRKRA